MTTILCYLNVLTLRANRVIIPTYKKLSETMAGRKRGRPAKTTQQSPKTLLSTANRTSLVVGGIIVLIVVLATAALGFKYLKHKLSFTAPTKQTSSVSITPTSSVSASVTPAASQTATATPTQTQPSQTAQAPVKKLPFTGSTDITYTVRENDSLASIGDKFCNDNRAWIYLEEKNNMDENSSIHPGDVIKIACQ